MELQQTLAPSLANKIAVALPIPAPAPVINATFPCNFILVYLQLNNKFTTTSYVSNLLIISDIISTFLISPLGESSSEIPNINLGKNKSNTCLT